MTKLDISKHTVGELLLMHDSILSELEKRQILRSRNNPAGDYAEWLVSTVLGLTLASKAAKGFDATSADGTRVQIKGRHVAASDKSVQMGVIRNLDGKDFDELISIVFEANWDVRAVARIPHAAVASVSTYRKHVNGHVMYLNDTVLGHKDVENITHRFKS